PRLGPADRLPARSQARRRAGAADLEAHGQGPERAGPRRGRTIPARALAALANQLLWSISPIGPRSRCGHQAITSTTTNTRLHTPITANRWSGSAAAAKKPTA